MILRAELELMLLGSGTAFDTNKSLAGPRLAGRVTLDKMSNWKLFDQSS